MSLVTLTYPVVFGNFTNDPVKIVFTLGAKDANSHLEVLAQLIELLTNKEDMSKIMQANSQEEVIAVIRQYP
jgi:PTS system ascorbate-specific IIA component